MFSCITYKYSYLRFIDEKIDLIPVEEFYKEAPATASTTNKVNSYFLFPAKYTNINNNMLQLIVIGWDRGKTRLRCPLLGVDDK
jgi:hypothetical protein